MLKDLSNGLASIRSLFLIESCHAFHLSQSEKTSELGLPRYPEMTPMPYTEPWCNFYHFIYLYFLFFSFYLHKKKKSCSTLYGDWLSLLWKTLHFVNSLYIVNADVLTSILCSCKTRVGDLRLLGDPSGGGRKTLRAESRRLPTMVVESVLSVHSDYHITLTMLNSRGHNFYFTQKLTFLVLWLL